MPFIGNQPALAYTSFAVQHFTTSATTSYTLDYPVANENEIRLVINNVVQQPGSSYAYTASGTSLTLSAATTGTDTMYAVFLGKAVQTVNPPNGSVGLSQLSATGTKDSTTFLRGDNTFSSLTTSGSYTTTITYSTTLTATPPASTLTKTAYYTKVGNIVVVSFPYITTTNTFSSNSVIITSFSLPFTSGANNRTVGTVFGYNLKGRYNTGIIDQATGTNFVTAVGESTTTMSVAAYTTNNTGSGFLYLDHAQGPDLNISCYYTT